MARVKTLAARWASVEQHIYSRAGFGFGLRRELRRCFYAGANEALALMHDASKANSEADYDALIAELEAFYTETGIQ